MKAVITVDSTLAGITRAHALVEQAGAAESLDARAVFAVKLALEEVLANIGAYAWDDGQTHQIQVELEVTPDGAVALAVEDDGCPFDPLAVPPPPVDAPLEEREPGGLGVFLTRRMMDTVRYERVGDRNRLTMTRRGRAP